MKKGTVIFNSKPFAYILSNSHRSQLCDSCFKGSENLLKCSKCAFAYYCNKKCQKAAWKLHKKECPNLKKVFPNIPTDSVRLLAQIIFLTKAGGSSVTENVGDMTRSFNDLISHAEKIQNDKNRLKQFCALVTTLKVYIGEENIPSGTELLEMFGKMVINSVTITTGDLRAVGAGLYLGLSKLDHSCKPNAVVNFDGIDASVRLIEDLSVADFNNVFISYIDQINLKEERQKQLLEQYYFTCHCCACCDPTIEDKMTEFLSNDDCTDVVRRLEENQAELTTNPQARLKTVLRALEESTDLLSTFHHLRVKEAQEGFDCSIEVQDWQNALHCGYQLIEPYRYYYGSYNPSVAITLMKLGKIELYLDNRQKAETVMLQAKNCMKICYGESHAVYKDLLELIIDARG